MEHMLKDQIWLLDNLSCHIPPGLYKIITGIWSLIQKLGSFK